MAERHLSLVMDVEESSLRHRLTASSFCRYLSFPCLSKLLKWPLIHSFYYLGVRVCQPVGGVFSRTPQAGPGANELNVRAGINFASADALSF